MAAVTFADHEGFQKTVLRASAGAAGAGFVTFVLSKLASGIGLPMSGEAQSYFALAATCAAAAAAACGKSWRGRLAYGLLGGLAGLSPLLFTDHRRFGLAAAGAAVGALFAWFRQKEALSEPSVGKSLIGRASFLAAMLLSAVAVMAGSSVVSAFFSYGVFDSLPEFLSMAGSTAIVGFFLSLGSSGAHIARDPDPVEKLYERIEPELRIGDLKILANRAMTNYRKCAEILENSEAGFARSQLSKSLNDVTTRVLELARRWQNIDREMGQAAEAEINGRLAELRRLKDTLKDESARKQLAGAEAAVMGELQQIDRIKRGRERLIARLHGEMAVLDRTRFALLGLKTSDAHLRAAELSAISESLSTVAREMDSETEAVDEIISKVVDVKDPIAAAQVAAASVGVQAVVPIQAPADPVPAPVPAEKAKA